MCAIDGGIGGQFCPEEISCAQKGEAKHNTYDNKSRFHLSSLFFFVNTADQSGRNNLQIKGYTM